MASSMFFTTLAISAVLYCACSAVPFGFPPTLPPATTEPTAATTTDNLPDSLKNFLKLHPVNSVPVAFNLQLATNVTLRKYATIELHNFTQVKPGQFSVGDSSIPAPIDEFVVPTKGVYHLTAQVHLFKDRRRITIDPYVTVCICIDGDCDNNAALQSRVLITYGHFSILATGELQVDKDQVVSVFVKNTSDRRLTINEETSFMGYFVSA